ncbi:unnamed protein product [Tetraodon nigroviridis]|uniref:(spotted green pufferfish) hypothetical protein n=1 Tax=Tetraodon nigroviridis TaxID=99883 RepID=Q4SFB2_TETNG|nr:unnamed protein product [Tetraodon nigroviridis]
MGDGSDAKIIIQREPAWARFRFHGVDPGPALNLSVSKDVQIEGVLWELNGWDGIARHLISPTAVKCSDLAWKLSAFSMDVVDPLAIWTGIGTGNEDEGIKMVFIQDIVGGRDPEHCVLGTCFFFFLGFTIVPEIPGLQRVFCSPQDLQLVERAVLSRVLVPASWQRGATQQPICDWAGEWGS